eukprot:scaffold5233_cov178-Amphora_coffeaeformis.AAC.1
MPKNERTIFDPRRGGGGGVGRGSKLRVMPKGWEMVSTHHKKEGVDTTSTTRRGSHGKDVDEN